MSITSCLLLFLLCLSLHASHARRLSVNDDRKLEKKSHFLNKNDDKANVDTISVLQKVNSSLSKELKATKRDSIAESGAYNNAQKPKDTKAKQKILKDEIKENTSGVDDKSESLVSISWRVPHKKRGEEQPGFNLDYSPPKTHPPSHN